MSKYEGMFSKSFFREISEEWLFWKWNQNKTDFMFELRPEIYEKYAYKEEHMYGYDYSWGFLQLLNELIYLWVIKNYERLASFNYDEKEYTNYFKENDIFIGKNFFYSYEEEWWIYSLEYLPEKLSLFKTIIFDWEQNLNIKKQLYKNILFLYNKEQWSWWLDNEKPKVFDCEIIADELNINNTIHHFNNFEIFFIAIWLHPDKKYMAELLNYVLNNIQKSDKYIIENILKKPWESFYIPSKGEDYFWEWYNNEYLREYYEHTQGVLYKKNIEDVLGLDNKEQECKQVIIYDNTKALLTYNWIKYCNFSQAPKQNEFIQKLYENLNKWVTKEQLWWNPRQILKDIRKKLKKQTGWWFTNAEIKKIFWTFDWDNTSYFIMIWW